MGSFNMKYCLQSETEIVVQQTPVQLKYLHTFVVSATIY